MLPRKLYELLPYLYIFTGIISASLVDSTVVLISSILLIVTGVFVFIMRTTYRKSGKSRVNTARMMTEPNVVDVYVRRSGCERRRQSQMATEWPIFDATGDEILFERRTGERRMSRV
jgi:hypothetical protein